MKIWYLILVGIIVSIGLVSAANTQSHPITEIDEFNTTDGLEVNITAGYNLNIQGNMTIWDKITFRFGEMIDNLVDGWLRITGNLLVTENLNVTKGIEGQNLTLRDAGTISNDSDTYTLEDFLYDSWAVNYTDYYNKSEVDSNLSLLGLQEVVDNNPNLNSNIISTANSTWDWLFPININATYIKTLNLNVTGTLNAGDLVWNGNLDLGENNLTNVDYGFFNYLGDITNRIKTMIIETISFNNTINDLYWDTSLVDDIATINWYVGGSDGTETDAEIWDMSDIGLDNLTYSQGNVSNYTIYYGDGSQLTGIITGINDTSIDITSLIVQQHSELTGVNASLLNVSTLGVFGDYGGIRAFSTAADKLVAYRIGSTAGTRAGLIVNEFNGVSNSASPFFGFNAFFEHNGTGDLTKSTRQGGAVGGRYQAVTRSSGDITRGGGISSQVVTVAGAGNFTESYAVLSEGCANAAGTSCGDYSAFWATEGSNVNGDMDNQYGLRCDDLTKGDFNTCVWADSDSIGITLGADKDANIYYDGTNLIFDYNTTNPDAVAWFSSDISVNNTITRTSVFDSSKGEASSFIKDSDDYKNPDGSINHSSFYGYTTRGFTDYSRPEIEKRCSVGEYEDGTEYDYCYDVEIFPHERIEEGVILNLEIDVLRQASYLDHQTIIQQNNTINLMKAQLEEICKLPNTKGVLSWCLNG